MTDNSTSETAKSAVATSPKGPQHDHGFRGDLLWRYLQEFVAPLTRQIIWALVLTAGLAAVTGGYPLIIKHSFDTILSGREGVLHIVLIAVVSITITRSILMYLQTVASNRIVFRIGTNMQKLAFARLMASDFSRQIREAPGQRVSRLTNDVGAVQMATQSGLNTAVRDTLSIAVLIGTMVYLDPVMSLVVLGVYPIAAWPIAMVSKRLRTVAKRTQIELGDMTALLTEKLSASRLIKTFRLENYAVDRLNSSFEDVYRLRIKAIRARARLDPILEALGGVAVAGVIALAYWRIANNNATVGDFMGFVSALLLAAQPIRAVGNLMARVNEGLAAAERIYEIIDDEPKIVDKPGAPPLQLTAGSFEFRDVTFSYAGHQQVPAVEHLSLTVPGGTSVALVGRSGAGKSTLINLIPRLFDVTSGSILIDGQDIRDVTVASLRDAIAIVSQDVTLFDDTIRANIAIGRASASDEKVQAAAKAAAAHDFIIAQNDGYDTRIGDSGSRLSGGQRQRLALARAILKDAPVLLLDEATSALDTHSERLVQSALAKFAENRTTFVIAHRLSTVQNADLICVMDEGRIIETGRHNELLARGGAYAELCRSQLLAGEDEASEPAAAQ